MRLARAGDRLGHRQRVRGRGRPLVGRGSPAVGLGSMRAPGHDGGAAQGNVGRVEQSLRGHGHEVGVAHPDGAVGEGEAHRIGHHVDRLHRTEAEARLASPSGKRSSIFSIWIMVRPPDDGGDIDLMRVAAIGAGGRLADIGW